MNSKRHANGDAPRTSCARRLGCPSVRNGQRSSEDRGLFPKEAHGPRYEGFASSICHNPTFMKAATVLLLLLVLLLLSREVKMYLLHIEQEETKSR